MKGIHKPWKMASSRYKLGNIQVEMEISHFFKREKKYQILTSSWQKKWGNLVSLYSLTCNSKFFFNEFNKSKHTKYTLKNENLETLD